MDTLSKVGEAAKPASKRGGGGERRWGGGGEGEGTKDAQRTLLSKRRHKHDQNNAPVKICAAKRGQPENVTYQSNSQPPSPGARPPPLGLKLPPGPGAVLG